MAWNDTYLRLLREDMIPPQEDGQVPQEPEVIPIAVCEFSRIIPRVGVLYYPYVSRGCKSCESIGRLCDG